MSAFNITEEDLSQAYTSGFSDGSVVRDKTAVSAQQYEKLQISFDTLALSNSYMIREYERLKAEHNRMANAVVTLQRIRDYFDNTDDLNRMFGVLDALGEVSPF